MSVCFDIACEDCKETLWIGQRNIIYRAKADIMKDLEVFLYKHMGHNLIFTPDEFTGGYEDFKRR